MRPKIGATYILADHDYQFGSGALLCRVTRILRHTTYNNEPWWEVEAMVKPPSTVGPAYERRLYLRESAITDPPTTMPDGPA